MQETKRSTDEILADFLSHDVHRLRRAVSEIRSLSQNHERVMEFTVWKPRMVLAVGHILSGPSYSSERRRLLNAFEIIDFHAKGTGCSCCLPGTEDNPKHLVADRYFDLLQTVPRTDCHYNDHYLVRCKRCGATYKVIEEEYHSLWWDWKPVEVHNGSTEKTISAD